MKRISKVMLLIYHMRPRGQALPGLPQMDRKEDHLRDSAFVVKMESHLDVTIALFARDAFLRWITTVFGLSIALVHATTSSFFCSCCIRSWRQRWIL